MNVESVKQYGARFAMLPPGTRVLCAVSGGADSVALLHILCAMPDVTVLCAHLNHCLRGEESERDERFVRELCASLGVPCRVERADVAACAAAEGCGIEAAARRLRYDFLERTAAAERCDRIATAHNADDNAETLLLHLLHGSGLRGLCGIPPVRGRIVRPLLNVPRSEIEAYLRAHGLAHVEDSSNESDDYTRNRIRHQVMPALRSIRPGTADSFGRAAETLREDEAFITGLADRFLEEARKENTLSASALAALPKPLAMRSMRTMCGELSRVHLEAVCALARNPAAHAAADLPGMRVVKDFDTLTFGALPLPEPLPRRELRVGESLLLPETGQRVECRAAIFDREIHNSFNTFCFHREKICGRIFIASRGAGDSVRLLGRGCTKTLKKLFSEARLSPAARLRTPVVYDEAGVAAIRGFGIAERLAPAIGDPVIVVEFSEENQIL